MNELILISKRGNLKGRNAKLEDDPSYIDKAIEVGFKVECDLWLNQEKLFLGHYYGVYPIDESYLLDRAYSLLIHCKNQESLVWCLDQRLHCFYHQNDKATITSQGFIICHSEFPFSSKFSIIMCPEEKPCDLGEKAGICSNFIENYV